MTKRHHFTPDQCQAGGLNAAAAPACHRICPVCQASGFATHDQYAGHVSTHSQAYRRPCPRCGRQDFRSLQERAGHLGLHTFADRYAGGNLRLAAEKLALCGQATTDPLPGNAAFSSAHDVLAAVRAQQKRLEDADF